MNELSHVKTICALFTQYDAKVCCKSIILMILDELKIGF